MYKGSLITAACAFIFLPLWFVWSYVVVAQSMQSTNYGIQSDSLNAGGGLSSSTNYTLESTAGEIASGESTSATYALKAGYQQMQEVYMSLSGTAAVVLDPTIPGVSGGVANGSTTALVTTDSPSGYSLSIESESAPAMQLGVNSIADYSTSSVPDFAFAVGLTDSHFGFSPFGDDVVSRYFNNGVACSTGSGATNLACWSGLMMAPTVIAQSTQPNHPAGTATLINFRVGVGGSVTQAPGVYVATTTITALPL